MVHRVTASEVSPRNMLRQSQGDEAKEARDSETSDPGESETAFRPSRQGLGRFER